MNKRSHDRVAVGLTCHVSIAKRHRRRLTGETKDISRTGVAINLHGRQSLAEIPKVGDVLTLDVELPPSALFGKKCLSCKARIVRKALVADGSALIAFRIEGLRVIDVAVPSPVN